MSKQTKRLIVILLILIIVLAFIIFRDQISAAINNIFRPIGPGGLPPELDPFSIP